MKLATICYVKDGNKTLMLYRNKKENDYHEGKWNGLGGKLEPRESPEDCAIREVYEESGIIVKKLELKGFITFPLFDGKDDWYVWVYFITEWEGSLQDSPEGELKWIDDDKITSLNLWDGDKIFIDWIYSGKTFSAKFNYTDGKFTDYEVSFY